MKNQIKLKLTLVLLLAASAIAHAQSDKKYKIVLESNKNGKEVKIDTSFSNKADMETFMKENGFSSPVVIEIPDLPEIPEIGSIMIELDGIELTPEQELKIKRELKEVHEKMKEAQLELKDNEKILWKAEKDLRKLEIEVEESGDHSRHIFIKNAGENEESNERIIFIQKGEPGRNENEQVIHLSGKGNDADQVKIIHLSGDENDEKQKVRVIIKSDSENDVNDELNLFEIQEEQGTEDLLATAENPKAESINETTDYRLPVSDFKLYPNPSDGKISVSFNLENPGPVEMRLLDASGKVLAEEAIQTDGGFINHEFNLEGKSRGTYLMQIKQGDKWRHEKVVLK